MRRILYSVLTMLVLLPVVTKAQEEPMPLSLQDAMDYAVKNNVNVKNARLDYLIQKAKNAEITTKVNIDNHKGKFRIWLIRMPPEYKVRASQDISMVIILYQARIRRVESPNRLPINSGKVETRAPK